MNKAQLLDAIAKESGLTKADSKRALDATLEAIKKSLKKNESVTLVGFGTFTVATREARNGRNPHTGELLKIKKAKVPKFRPGQGLKDAVSGAKKKK